MKMKTITIKGQNYKVAADATIAAPGWVTGIYYRAGKKLVFYRRGKQGGFIAWRPAWRAFGSQPL